MRRFALATGERRLPPLKPYGRYAAPSWIQRHRWIAYGLLALFCLLYGYAFAIYGYWLPAQVMMPLALPLALVIWLLPDQQRAPTIWIDRLLIAFLAALLAWPDYVAIDLPGLPWLTAIRLTTIPLAIVLLVCTSVSAEFRRTMRTTLSAAPLVWQMLMAFTLIAVATIALSQNPVSSLNKFLVAQLTWTSIFFASVYTFRKPGRMRVAMMVLWGTVLANLIFSLYELRFHRALWAGHLPSFLTVEDPTAQNMLGTFATSATRGYRLHSKFTTPLALSEYLALASPLILHIGVSVRSTVVRAGAFATLAAMLFMVINTDARTGAIGMFLGITLYLLGWAVLRWRRNNRDTIATLVILAYPAVFALLVVASLTITRIRKQMWGGGDTQSSSEARRLMWHQGLPMVAHNPIGHGPGQGAITLGFRSPTGILTIDTYYLVVLLEYGLLGFALYFGTFLYAIYRAGLAVVSTSDREVAWLVPLGIALLNFVIIKYVFSQQDNHPFAFMMLGMVVALVARARSLDPKAIDKPAPSGGVRVYAR